MFARNFAAKLCLNITEWIPSPGQKKHLLHCSKSGKTVVEDVDAEGVVATNVDVDA